MLITYQSTFLLLHHGLDVSYVKPIPHRNLDIADLAEDLFRCNVHDESARLRGRGGWMLRKKSIDENQPSRVRSSCLFVYVRSS